MQEFFSGKILLPCALAMLLGACGDDDDDSSNPPPGGGGNTMGTLNIDIRPNNFQGARVIVTGPGITPRSVEQDSALALSPGNYAISVVGVRVDQPIVDDVVGAVDKSAVTIVTDGTETVVANYAQVQSGAGNLWYPVRLDGQVHGFNRDQLQAGFDGPGNVSITGVGTAPINTAFDTGGNLWVALFNDNAIVKYNADQLAEGGSLMPDVTISTDDAGSLNGPIGLAFDGSGNLWVGNFGPLSDGDSNDTLVQFTPQQLAASGQPTPEVALEGFTRPYGHAFDADGNLWVGNNGADTVLRFPAAQQTNDGASDLTITDSSGGPLDGPRGIAFAADGTMWVSSANSSQAASYTFDDAGAPTAAVTVNLKDANGATVPSPDGLAFDDEGNLWVADSSSNVFRYDAADLTDGANVQPAATLTGFGTSQGILFSFYPPALNLPLAQ